mmetsp:Transcript_70602/g.218296  ORF Transcript_70602/g.218296 Transcript_70602/m.218296 type:complete len:201 (-) Transcript_70602:184-786(-)
MEPCHRQMIEKTMNSNRMRCASKPVGIPTPKIRISEPYARHEHQARPSWSLKNIGLGNVATPEPGAAPQNHSRELLGCTTSCTFCMTACTRASTIACSWQRQTERLCTSEADGLAGRRPRMVRYVAATSPKMRQSSRRKWSAPAPSTETARSGGRKSSKVWQPSAVRPRLRPMPLSSSWSTLERSEWHHSPRPLAAFPWR